MAITINKLAKASGVSVRTLRYYDEIGLLKPAYYGDNQYRYYKEEQALLLQQILFYRELGLALNDIKALLTSDTFNKAQALRTHREKLNADLEHTTKLLKTIDHTISHLEDNQMIKLEDIFNGFTQEKHAYYENYLMENGVSADTIKQSRENVKHWDKAQWVQNKADNDAVYADLVKAIDQGLTAKSGTVQAIIDRHYKLTCIFWTPNQETYMALADMYRANADFEAFFDNIHPKLLDYMIDAMSHYAKSTLSQ